MSLNCYYQITPIGESNGLTPEILFQTDSGSLSGYLNLQPIRNMYISSPNLGNYNTIGANGERSVVKMIPVTENFKYMNFNNVLTGNDFPDCSRQTLQQIEFKLTDVMGNAIPLHGANCSFSVLFDIMNPNM